MNHIKRISTILLPLEDKGLITKVNISARYIADLNILDNKECVYQVSLEFDFINKIISNRRGYVPGDEIDSYTGDLNKLDLVEYSPDFFAYHYIQHILLEYGYIISDSNRIFSNEINNIIFTFRYVDSNYKSATKDKILYCIKAINTHEILGNLFKLSIVTHGSNIDNFKFNEYYFFDISRKNINECIDSIIKIENIIDYEIRISSDELGLIIIQNYYSYIRLIIKNKNTKMTKAIDYNNLIDEIENKVFRI